jgi:hypothetical protein
MLLYEYCVSSFLLTRSFMLWVIKVMEESRYIYNTIFGCKIYDRISFKLVSFN